MCDLTDFQRGQIVGARLAGSSVSKTAQLLGFSRTTVSTVMTAYTKFGKTSSAKKKSGRKTILTERDRRSLQRIVRRKHRTSASQVTSEINIHLEHPISVKTTRRELHKLNMYGRAAIAKPLISATNAKVRKRWCLDHQMWTADDWKRVIWSDESTFTLFQTSGRVYVWRSPKEAYASDCLLPTLKHGGGALMIWAAISWYSVGPIISLKGRVTANEYLCILSDQVHPMTQMLFPNNDAIYQDDNAPIHTARKVQEWFHEHQDEVGHLQWPAQSPDLNIIEPLWAVLETRVRARFPPPNNLTQLAAFLEEEWLKIPLETIQRFYESIPRRLEAVIGAKGGPTPY